VLEPFMASVAELGRLPEAGEFAGAAAVVERFGSLKRAFALVRRVTDPTGWEAIRQRRTEDMLVYMALAPFCIAAERVESPAWLPAAPLRVCQRKSKKSSNWAPSRLRQCGRIASVRGDLRDCSARGQGYRCKR
jgi:hypothetical protein